MHSECVHNFFAVKMDRLKSSVDPVEMPQERMQHLTRVRYKQHSGNLDKINLEMAKFVHNSFFWHFKMNSLILNQPPSFSEAKLQSSQFIIIKMLQ